MEKEEILRKAQSQNKRDEMELQAEVFGGKLAFVVGIIICMALMGVKVFAGEPFADSYGMLGLMASVPHFYCWRKLHKKIELWNGLVWFLVGSYFMVLYIRSVL